MASSKWVIATQGWYGEGVVFHNCIHFISLLFTTVETTDFTQSTTTPVASFDDPRQTLCSSHPLSWLEPPPWQRRARWTAEKEDCSQLGVTRMVDHFSQTSLVSFAFDTTVPSSFIKPDFSHMTSYIFLRIPSSSPTNCRVLRFRNKNPDHLLFVGYTLDL